MNLVRPDMGKLVYLVIGIAVAKVVLPKLGG